MIDTNDVNSALDQANVAQSVETAFSAIVGRELG